MLGDQRGAAAHEVGERTLRNRLIGGLRRADQALPERVSKGSPKIGTAAEQAREHPGRLRRDERGTYRAPAARGWSLPPVFEASIWRYVRTDFPSGVGGRRGPVTRPF